MKPESLLRLYPRAWRERYAREFGALLESEPITWRTAIDVGRAAMSERLRSSGGEFTSWQRTARLMGVMCGTFVALTVVMTIADVARFQHRMATPGDFAVLHPRVLLHELTTRRNAFIGIFNLWLGPYLFSLLFAALVRAIGWSRRRPVGSKALVVLGWPLLLLAIIATRTSELRITWTGVVAWSYFTVVGWSVWWSLFSRPRMSESKPHEV